MFQFINRQFIPETTYSSKDQVQDWTVEAQVHEQVLNIISVWRCRDHFFVGHPEVGIMLGTGR